MRGCAGGIALSIAVLWAVPLAWGDANGQWQRLESQPDCMIWNDDSQRGNAVTWSGSCVGGKADGQGIAVRKYFEAGEWKESRFEGNQESGKAHGYGVWLGPDGARYEGEWKDGRPDGQGITWYSSGDRYEGSHRGGAFDGRGIYSWPDGERYEGEFRGNRMHGHGVYIYSDGGTYEGEWMEGVKYGQGIRTWADGSQFEGLFIADNPHGDGKCQNAGGESGPCRFTHGQFTGWQ